MPRPMKDSGVEWLGEIPAHWNCCKLKYLISSLNSGTSITTTDLTDEGYPVYGGGQQIGFFPQFNMENTLIIGRVGSCGCVTKISGKAWATDNALIVTTDFPKDYLYYILVAAELNKLSTSNAQPLITSGKVLNHKVAVSPLDEQQRIANFLDGECARIDSVIEKTRASIVEYKKLKQAIITRAVTKGIRPALTMKDSGVEWLGDIPADWEINRLKNLFILQRGYDLSSEKFIEGDFPIYGSGGLMGYHNQKTSTAPNVVIGRSGSTGKLHYVEKDFWAHNTGIFISDKKGNFCKYLYYLLSIVDMVELSTKTAVPTLDRKKIQEYKLPYTTDIEEQKEIAQYLDEKTAAIDLLVEKKNQLVTELERLKKSLIFEYVTGKKAVPA